MDKAFEYAEKTPINTEKAYPYKSGDTGDTGKCNVAHEKGGFVTVNKYHDVKKKNIKAMKAAIAKTPVSVAICAEK